MAKTFVSRDLKRHTSFITKDGQELEGITYQQLRRGVQPTNTQQVIEETIEEKKARLQKELAELDALN